MPYQYQPRLSFGADGDGSLGMAGTSPTHSHTQVAGYPLTVTRSGLGGQGARNKVSVHSVPLCIGIEPKTF